MYITDSIPSASQPKQPSAPTLTTITVARGDGIGPEIMQATLDILRAAGAQIRIEEVEVGEKLYLAGHSSGISAESWETIRRNRYFLKAPISTPQGGGYKSLNVSMRKMLGLYANVRPCRSLHPFVQTLHPDMDVVIVRENEEDLYAGIEHQQTDEVVQCLKLISRPGCEKIVRYAFEYAKQHGRKKVTCLVKDNIMKQTDGLFYQVFEEIGAEYPELQRDRMIVDIGAARLADTPEAFDVLVMPNLYGDILSDVAAQIAGSVGLAGSANIGERCAIFEAIHGSAPDIAGKDVANPSGLLQSALMLLSHIGQGAVAQRIQNAWLRTLEEGIHTPDIFRPGHSKERVGTRAFAKAVIERLGQKPLSVAAAPLPPKAAFSLPAYQRKPQAEKQLVGIDLFVHARDLKADTLAQQLQALDTPILQLQIITNRGVKVWPQGFPETFCTDHWRCRFQVRENQTLHPRHLVMLLAKAVDLGMDVIKTENLYTFGGKPGFSLGQGQ